MGALCEEAIAYEVKYLVEHDPEMKENAIDAEKQIDRKERDIESHCMKLLIHQQPVATDFRVITSALKMISDMERIGDQAKDIAEIAEYVHLSDLSARVHITNMAEAAVHMVNNSIDSYVKKDIKADIANDVNSCNLVLGIDEYLSGEAKDKDNEFIQFKKFFQRIQKGTGCLYTDWVSLINDNNKRFAKASPTINNVYIYGHSLDVTDADIFRRLILLDNTITTIFYHSKESMGSQIANLVKVIGEDELIKRTDGSNRSIIFKQSSSEKL